MKTNQSSLLLILLLNLCVLSGIAQDSTKATSGRDLPSSDTTVSDDGRYQPNAIQEYNDAYYILNRLNHPNGLPPNKLNFQTPQATLEHFIVSSRNNNYEEAAYALNLNLMPDNLTKEQAGTLAEKLYFVLNQRIKIDWGSLSDRPDGQIDISTATNQAIAGKPLRCFW